MPPFSSSPLPQFRLSSNSDETWTPPSPDRKRWQKEGVHTHASGLDPVPFLYGTRFCLCKVRDVLFLPGAYMVSRIVNAEGSVGNSEAGCVNLAVRHTARKKHSLAGVASFWIDSSAYIRLPQYHVWETGKRERA